MTINVGSRSFADVDALEKLVIHAATEYETEGFVEDFDGNEITDPEYDALYKVLKDKKLDSEAFQGTSPSTATISDDTVTHDPPMTSIAKSDGDDAEKEQIYNDWKSSCAAKLGVSVAQIVFAQSFKRDGLALRVNYMKGKLVSAGLRPSDGINGTDVTRHMVNIEGVPKKLALPLTLSLNGEIECHLSDFEELNKKRDADGEEPYKNPRNYTSGCMGRDDAKENKGCRLRVSWYSITGFEDWQQYYDSEQTRARWANTKAGLCLQDDKGRGYFVRVIKHTQYSELVAMEKKAKELHYYTDGVVLKVDDLEVQEELGHQGDDNVKPPRGALAWKYEEETAEAEVSSIEWNATRTGRVVPTAVFDTPFVLADTSNTRATCNNYGWMKDRGLGPGAKVRAKKGGKIIPNIMEVLTPVSDMGDPQDCPTCSTKLRIHTSDSGNKDLRCENEDCGAKHIHSWLHYLQMMGAKGLGASAMQKILNSGHVKTLDQLYALTEDNLTGHFSEREALLAVATIWKIPNASKKDDDKVRTAIEKTQAKKQKVDAWLFFAALGIAGAGRTAGKHLVVHFGDFNKIMHASASDLEACDGIGDTTADAIRVYFDKNESMVERLLAYVELTIPKTGKLSGKNFCLTGSFDLKKSHWEGLIQEQGGNIQSSVGSKTNYLVQQHGKTDGSPSAKEEKAEASDNCTIISIPELEKLLA